MKIILTGATGFIGQEILQQCIEHPTITRIVALSRRALPSEQIKNSKVESIIVSDFRSYDNEVVRKLDDADAWIWALGKAWMPDQAAARTVHVDFPLAAARALAEQTSRSTPTRFVLLSGGAAERDQTKSLWLADAYRKIRGQAETEVCAYCHQHPDKLQVHVVRPGMVLKKSFNLRDAVRGLLPSVKVDVLARTMIKVAIAGTTKESLENADINAL